MFSFIKQYLKMLFCNHRTLKIDYDSYHLPYVVCARCGQYIDNPKLKHKWVKVNGTDKFDS